MRLAALVGVLLALLWLTEAILLPSIVRRQVAAALAGAGLRDASFEVRSVSLWSAELTNIVANGGRLRIGSVMARYSPIAAIGGDLGSVQIIGAQVHLPLEVARSKQTAPPASSPKQRRFPFQRLEVRSSQLITSSDTVWVPCEGTLVNRGDGKLAGDLSASVLGAAVTAAGIVSHIELEMDGGGQIGRLTGTASADRVQVGGQTFQRVTVKAEKAGESLAYQAQAAGAGWRLSKLDGKLLGLFGQADQGYRAEAQWAAEGKPSWLEERLRSSGFGTDKLSQMSLSGMASAAYRGGDRWSITAPDVKVMLPAGDVDLPGRASEAEARGKLRGIQGVLHVSAEVSSKEAVVYVANDSWIGFQTLEAPAGGGMLRVGESRIGIVPPKNVPALRMTFGPNAGKPQIGFIAATEKTSVAWEAAGIALSDVALSVPISWNLLETPKGELSVGSIAVQDKKFPPLSGAVQLADGKVVFDAAWPLLKNGTLAANGWVDVMAAAPSLDITGSLPKFKIEDEKELGTLWASLQKIGITGTFSGDAHVKFDRGRLQPIVHLTAEDAKLTSAEYDATVEGITGSVTFRNFSPLITPGNQQATVRRANLGKWEMSNGGVTFRVENAHSILIEQTQWNWLRGRVFSESFRIDTSSPDVQAVMYAEDLNVKDMLSLFSGGQATGEGTVYGRVPVRIKWPRVTLGNGFLYSTPGTGILQLGDTVGVVGNLLDQSDPRFAKDPMYSQVKTRIMAALKDFQYNVVKVDFKPDKEGVVATVSIQGKGRVGEKPQELNLNIAASGLDRLLSDYLAIRKNISASFGSEPGKAAP